MPTRIIILVWRPVSYTHLRVDVHRVDILRAGRADFNDLPLKFLHQCRVLGFRIAHDYIVIRHQERIGDFSLGREGFTGTGSTQNQPVGVFELFPVNHNQVVGQRIQPIVQSLFPLSLIHIWHVPPPRSSISAS